LAIPTLFLIFTSLNIIASTTLQAMGKTKVFLKITLATIAVDLAASILLVPRFGVNGAAIARAAMMIAGFIYTFHELKRLVKVKVDGKSMLKTFIASLTMAIPLVIFDTFYSGVVVTDVALGVAVELTFGASLYGLMMLLLRALNRQDFELLRGMSPRPLSRVLNPFERFFP